MSKDTTNTADQTPPKDAEHTCTLCGSRCHQRDERGRCIGCAAAAPRVAGDAQPATPAVKDAGGGDEHIPMPASVGSNHPCATCGHTRDDHGRHCCWINGCKCGRFVYSPDATAAPAQPAPTGEGVTAYIKDLRERLFRLELNGHVVDAVEIERHRKIRALAIVLAQECAALVTADTGTISELKAQRDEQAATTASLQSKLAAAEAVIGKLPKTADGVTVLPGDKVYTTGGAEWIIRGNEWGYIATEPLGGDSDPSSDVSQCYSTLALALAASAATPTGKTPTTRKER